LRLKAEYEKLNTEEKRIADGEFKIPEEEQTKYVEVFNGLLRDALTSCPGLQSFEISGVSELQNETVELLKKKSKEGCLTKVSLGFYEEMVRYLDRTYTYDVEAVEEECRHYDCTHKTNRL